MREIVIYGQPKVYYSEYSPQTDLAAFLTDVTRQAYSETGVDLEVLNNHPPVLRHHHCLGENSFDCDYILFKEDDVIPNTPDLINKFSTEGRHLKIVRVWMESITDNDGNICYRIKMDSKTIFPQQDNTLLNENLPPETVMEKVKMSYEKLDEGFMKPFLDRDVHYQSFMVFNEITSREEYLEYISHKFKVWRNENIHPEIVVSKDENSENDFCLHFDNMITDGTIPTLHIKVNNGRVVSFYMSAEALDVERLLPLLKEKPGRLDDNQLFDATINAVGPFEKTFMPEEYNFRWLQHVAMQPCNQHMCFTYKSIVLSVYVAPVYGDTIYVSRDEIAYFEQFRNENHLTTALLPVWLNTLKPIKDGLLLDPDTLQPMDLEKINDENDIYYMTQWEANAMAWFNTHFYLAYNGCSIDQATNVPNAYPQIVATTKEGEKFYCIVNAMSIGNVNKELTLDIMLASQCKELDGYFVNEVYVNKYTTFDFNENYLLRVGGQWGNSIELVPLSEVSSRFPYIHLNITYFDVDD